MPPTFHLRQSSGGQVGSKAYFAGINVTFT